jgi:AcrR family transcriptional regulator
MDMQTRDTKQVNSRKPARHSDNERAQAVLDSAEALFALHGFDGVTVRQIAKLAKVDVALPSYYFGSKRELLNAVFERRAMVFNKARSDALDEVAARWGDTRAPLYEVIEAFLRPVAEAQMSGDAGWRNYCRLVAQVNSSPVWVRMMTSHFDELIRKFIDMVGKALPQARTEDLYWAYQCLSGSLSLAMADTGRIQQLSSGLCRSDDFAVLYEKMVALYVAGFSAVAEGNAPSSR